MIRNLLILIFKRIGYAIKLTKLNASKKYKIFSDRPGLSLYDTPTGKYYLPDKIKTDHVANMIKNGLCFDEEIIEVAKKHFRKSSAILDIGANFGQMTVVLSKFVQENGGGVIYSFEAEPYVAEILKYNLEINNCRNVVIVPGAVHKIAGNQVIFPEPDFKRFSAYGSYGIDPLAKTGRTIETISIDSLNIQEPISFIKIDIQGCDLFALQGARETILKNKPTIIFEYEEQFQEEFGTSFNDYVEFIKSINYKFVRTYMLINYLAVPNE